jgi:hypothetical protein
MKLWPFLFLAAAMLFSMPSAIPAAESPVARRIGMFNLELAGIGEVPDQERAGKVRTMYRGHFGDVVPAKLEDTELQALFRLTLNAASLGYDPDIAARARLLFEELRARSLQTGSDYQYMQGLYVRLRLLDEAARFHAAHRGEAELERLPSIEGERPPAGRPSVFALVGGIDRLQRRSVDLAGGRMVLVVAHPLCHFTVQAADAIAGDGELRDFFAAHSTWVVPPDFRFHLAEIRDWNRHRPAFELALAEDIEEWPAITTWNTPTFYFFERGRLVETVEGWPEGGRKAALLDAIHQGRQRDQTQGAGFTDASR